jgi:hypothetical protein
MIQESCESYEIISEVLGEENTTGFNTPVVMFLHVHNAV